MFKKIESLRFSDWLIIVNNGLGGGEMTSKYLAWVTGWIMVPSKELENIGTVTVWGGKRDNWAGSKWVKFQEQWKSLVDNEWWV